MSSPQVDQLIRSVTAGGVPTVASIEAALATTLKPTQENPHWKFYAFDLAGGPFKGGEFRVSLAGDRALLSLTPREGTLAEADLDLKQWGTAVNVEINPQIPPEGTDAYSYAVSGARLSFQFTHVSRKLRTLAIEWGRKA